MRNPLPLAAALFLVSVGLELAALFPEQTTNYWQLLVLIGVVGQLLAVMVVFSARRTRRAIAAVVQTDPLTQIGNRRRLERVLAAGSGELVLFCDLDHFGRINAREGHLAGDRVLVACAAALAKLAPTGTVVCRFGGEEFVLLLYGKSLTEGGTISEAIRTAFAEARLGAEQGESLTLTAGVALRAADETGDAVLRRADAALWAAKEAGRNQTFLHDGQRVGPVAEIC